MVWIQSHSGLATNRKTKRLSRRLGVSVNETIGMLHQLWWWAIEHAFSGDLSGYDNEDLADVVGWDGDPDELVDALVSCGSAGKHGFLERDGTDADGRPGTLVIHDWAEYTDGIRARHQQSLKANHVRHHESVGVTNPDCAFCCPDGPPPNGQNTLHIPGESETPAETNSSTPAAAKPADPDSRVPEPQLAADGLPEDSDRNPTGSPRTPNGTDPAPTGVPLESPKTSPLTPQGLPEDSSRNARGAKYAPSGVLDEPQLQHSMKLRTTGHNHSELAAVLPEESPGSQPGSSGTPLGSSPAPLGVSEDSQRTPQWTPDKKRRERNPPVGPPAESEPLQEPQTRQSSRNRDSLPSHTQSGPEPASKARKKTELAEDWQPESDEKLAAEAAERGVAIDWAWERDQFVDYWRSKGEQRKDWQATWRNWIRKSVTFQRSRGTSVGPQQVHQLHHDIRPDGSRKGVA